jgi:lipopolysaccharide/colanic/teichoic acid biosynthesis glycosyltransferase
MLMILIALAIVFDSPGSPFFVQERVGKGGRRFRMVKFRTMRCDHNDQRDRAFMQAYVNGELAADMDSRDMDSRDMDSRDALNKPIKKGDITRAGRFLRKASLDELPQVINVLRGEMSLIGPRPNVPWEVECYRDWHYERLELLPGITGLAQVHGRSTISFDEIVTYDIAYIRNLSFRMDLQIMVQTVVSVFSGNGAG